MKKSLTESKTIRLYMLLWGLFISGIWIAFATGGSHNPWKAIALVSFIIGFISCLAIILMTELIQAEIRVRYSRAVEGEKRFLIGLFHFVRGIFLLLGIVLLLAAGLRKDIPAKDVVEIGGKVSSIEVVGHDQPSLKLALAHTSNQYGIADFKMPHGRLQQIEKEIRPGDLVFVLIERSDQNARNEPYIQIYGIRTQSNIYLSIDEFNKADSTNNSYGFALGIFFGGIGLIYLLTGRIKMKPSQGMQTNHNASGV